MPITAQPELQLRILLPIQKHHTYSHSLRSNSDSLSNSFFYVAVCAFTTLFPFTTEKSGHLQVAITPLVIELLD